MTHRHLIGEALNWLAAAIILAVVAANFQTIRRAASDAVVAHSPPPGASKASQSGETAQVAEPHQKRDGVELRADRAGHFEANMEVNGRALDAMVDTGASIVMLTYEDAQRAGIYLRPQDFTMQMQTANGIAKAAPVTLERLAVGSILLRDVQAGVGEPGLLHTNLLGMSFLKRLHSFEIHAGTLVLQD